MPADILSRLFSFSLGDWGSVASIVSLGVTILVLVSIRTIRRDFLYRARVPQLLDRLGSHRSNLSTFLTDFANSAKDFRHELALIESTLRSLEPKLRILNGERRAARKVRRLVARGRVADMRGENAVVLYDDICYLAERLEHYRKDREWQ